MKYSRPWNIRAHEIFAPMKYLRPWNICTYPKYLRIHKISAPHQECLRLIIYDSNKAAVEIFAAYERCMRPKYRRPNSYYLGSAESPTSAPSQSGWRALSQMVLPLLHAVLKWDLLSDRPAYMGGVSAVLYRLLYWHNLPKYSRPIQMFGREYFHLFSGKNQKPNSAHKCPTTSVQIRT